MNMDMNVEYVREIKEKSLCVQVWERKRRIKQNQPSRRTQKGFGINEDDKLW